jgi:hypothetical protein
LTRSTMRFVDWHISPDDRPPAQPVMFQMQCVACAIYHAPDDVTSVSPASENFADVQDWALRHSGRHSTHTAYREHVQRSWRTFMLDTPPR